MSLNSLPEEVQTIVVGAGTAGCALTGMLAQRSEESILLLEAGPDYGAGVDRWPADLLDARDLAESHSWHYDSDQQYPNRKIPFDRARVIGGCSSHNGCAAIWGSHLDYDGWHAAGNDGWSTGEVLPFLQHASQQLRVRIPQPEEITPYQRILLGGAPAAGIPLTENLNDLYEDLGMAPSPANVENGVRYNASFAYLDPVRRLPHLTVHPDGLADQVEITGDRVTGLWLISEGERRLVRAKRVVLCGGTYGTPAILLRSGIGPAEHLKQLGIAVQRDLPGVGHNLHDHPNVDLAYQGTNALKTAMEEFGRVHWLPEEQTIAKARSTSCVEGFDVHIYPAGSRWGGNWSFVVPVACMTPKSRGTLHLRSTDPAASPAIDHAYLSDEAGSDRSVLIDAIAIAREIVTGSPDRALLGPEIAPGPALSSPGALSDWIDENVAHYYHPVGTCKMGPASQVDSVVDATGHVHGIAGLYVADCSIIPVIPRANTNIPAAMIGEVIASRLL